MAYGGMLPFIPESGRLALAGTHVHALAAPHESGIPEVASWPFSASVDLADALRRLLSAAEGLPLTGWESSWRATPASTCGDRLLFGFATAGVAAARLQALPAALGMPAVLADGFLAELPDSQRILLAIERGAQGVEMKAYHEFEADALGDLLPPLLAMRGRKWRQARIDGEGVNRADAIPPAHVAMRVSDYFRPGVQPRQLADLLRTRTGVPLAAHPAYEMLAAAVERAAVNNSSGWHGDFLVVTEPPSQRLSCCVRFYDSGLCMADLNDLMATLAQVWNISGAAFARLPCHRRLTWIAAGLDGSGQPFFNVYGQASLADARHLLALGAINDQN